MSDYTSFIDNYIARVIRTLDSTGIYDMLLETLVNLLQPDGLMLSFLGKTDRAYHVTRHWGDISFQKDYCIPSDATLNQLASAENYIDLKHSFDLFFTATSRQKHWLLDQDVTAIYTLRYNKVIIGFIYIVNHTRHALSEEQLQQLDQLAYYTSYALRNANLYQNAYQASITDDLTSLYNRKHAFECINNWCAKKQPASLILLDIDDFKLYNELYSAAEGDNLICHCARIILQELSENDLAFRYGADEFLILTQGNDTNSAKSLISRIIDRITQFGSADMVWDMTITCGIATFPDVAKDASTFLHNAEQAVYYGKHEGKGHVLVYRSGMEDRCQNPDIRAAYERVAPTIYALTAAIDAKDSYTFVHSMNVSKYAVALAESLNMNNSEIEMIRDAGMLHDIGKISIPESILKKTTHLTDAEYEIMKTHVENSTKMIRYLPDMDYVIPAVVGHHERYDGKGYPRGLSGENIPFMARILTIADCFDAMTAKRPYKQPMPVSYAISELQKNSGTQFDPNLVSHFVSLIYEGKIAV